ncbi:MAG: DUF1697 domain-containing protein [Vicinamibacterales bacterium]
MPRFAILLRGVNVGKANRISMADFRRTLETVGCTDVQTLLNSGNAVATCPYRVSSRLAQSTQDELAKSFGLQVNVIAKSARELAAVIAGNTIPMTGRDPARLLVGLSQDSAAIAGLADLTSLVRAPDVLLLGSDAVYVYCAKGIRESAAALALLGPRGRSLTTRNWATVLKIDTLLRNPD